MNKEIRNQEFEPNAIFEEENFQQMKELIGQELERRSELPRSEAQKEEPLYVCFHNCFDHVEELEKFIEFEFKPNEKTFQDPQRTFPIINITSDVLPPEKEGKKKKKKKKKKKSDEIPVEESIMSEVNNES